MINALILTLCSVPMHSAHLNSINKVAATFLRSRGPQRNDTLKQKVANIAFSVGFRLWNEVMFDLDQTYRRLDPQSAENVLEMTANIGTEIASKIPIGFNRNNHHQLRYQQSSISDFYALIIRNFNGSQADFVQLMAVMMRQNIRLQIGMEAVVWNQWIGRYFSLNPQAVWMRSILTQMTESGSGLQPDGETLEVVIDTILNNEAIKEPELMIEQIVNDFKAFNIGIPLQSQFQLMMRGGDRVQMMRFLRLHPERRFKGADIAVFNDILCNLHRDYSEWFSDSKEDKIVFIVNKLMPFYGGGDSDRRWTQSTSMLPRPFGAGNAMHQNIRSLGGSRESEEGGRCVAAKDGDSGIQSDSVCDSPFSTKAHSEGVDGGECGVRILFGSESRSEIGGHRSGERERFDDRVHCSD